MAYTQNVPQATQTIAFTQPIIESNFQFLQADIGIEHNFNAGGIANDMYHKFASMPNASPDPPTLTPGATGAYYVSGGDARFLSGSTVCQLTAGVASANGYQWIGRVLLQWGNVSTNFNGMGTGTVTFATDNIKFPLNCFQVLCSMNGSSSTVNIVEVVSQTASSFNWKFTGGGGASTSYTGFSWMAIGN